MKFDLPLEPAHQVQKGGQIYGAILEAEGAIPALQTNLAQEPDADAERIAARYTSPEGPPRCDGEIRRRGFIRRRCCQAPRRAFAIQSAARQLRVGRIT
jgi:hypothetical protein